MCLTRTPFLWVGACSMRLNRGSFQNEVERKRGIQIERHREKKTAKERHDGKGERGERVNEQEKGEREREKEREMKREEEQEYEQEEQEEDQEQEEEQEQGQEEQEETGQVQKGRFGREEKEHEKERKKERQNHKRRDEEVTHTKPTATYKYTYISCHFKLKMYHFLTNTHYQI